MSRPAAVCLYTVCLNVQIGFGATPLSYGFPGGYAGGSTVDASGASYLASPGLVYPPPQSSSYSPRSPGHGQVKLGRSPDSQGGSSAGSSSSGRPPTAADSPGPGPDYPRHPLLVRPSDYYPTDDVRGMIGMYLPGAQVNSPGELPSSHQWMNPAARFVHQYVTSPGHVGSDITDEAARINAAFTRLA